MLSARRPERPDVPNRCFHIALAIYEKLIESDYHTTKEGTLRAANSAALPPGRTVHLHLALCGVTDG